jgi:hypothetical protein
MKRHFGLLAGVLGILAGFADCVGAWGDQVVLSNGHAVSGDIIAQDDKSVTVDLSDATEARTRKILRTQISRIDTWGHPSSQGPEFIALPVQGIMGVDISAHALKAGIAGAVRLSPKYVILYIDSDGGSLKELEDMVDVIHALPPGIQTVALVHKAYSAAAVLAMACPKIFVTPDAVIGAAVPLQHAMNGMPQDIAAKYVSAIEAKQRNWVTAAGHDDLLLRGMMEMDLEIYIRHVGDTVDVSTSGPGRLVKGENQILTLMANDAVECGLAAGANDFDDVGKQLAKRACSEASQRPWDAVVRVARHDRHQLNVKTAEAKIAPQLIAIVDRAKVLIAQIKADKAKAAQLEADQGAAAGPAIEVLRRDAQGAAAELKDLQEQFIQLQSMVPQYYE